MKRDYSDLLAKIILKYGTRNSFAKEMNVSLATLISRLSGKSDFTQKEIEKICELLEIDHEEIPMYFFKVLV